MKIKWIILLTLILLRALLSESVDANGSEPLRPEDMQVRYVDLKTNQEHARARCVIREQPGEKGVFSIRIEGEGDYADYRDVLIERESSVEAGVPFVFTRRTRTVVRRRDGAVVAEFLKKYDRDARRIFFEKTGQQGEVLQRAVYPLEGPTCDDVTLMTFLKAVVKDPDNKAAQAFYLITDEPRRYRVIIRARGEEALALPGGAVTAKKFQLIGDLGPLSDLAAKVIPPTFVWYSPRPPFDWWQYEGMECGPKSAYIRAFVEKREMQYDAE